MKNNKMLMVGVLGLVFAIGSFTSMLGMETSKSVEFKFINEGKKELFFSAILCEDFGRFKLRFEEIFPYDFKYPRVGPGQNFKLEQKGFFNIIHRGVSSKACYWDISVYSQSPDQSNFVIGEEKCFHVHFSLDNQLEAFEIRCLRKDTGFLKARAKIAGVWQDLRVEKLPHQ